MYNSRFKMEKAKRLTLNTETEQMPNPMRQCTYAINQHKLFG